MLKSYRGLLFSHSYYNLHFNVWFSFEEHSGLLHFKPWHQSVPPVMILWPDGSRHSTVILVNHTCESSSSLLFEPVGFDNIVPRTECGTCFLYGASRRLQPSVSNDWTGTPGPIQASGTDPFCHSPWHVSVHCRQEPWQRLSRNACGSPRFSQNLVNLMHTCLQGVLAAFNILWHFKIYALFLSKVLHSSQGMCPTTTNASRKALKLQIAGCKNYSKLIMTILDRWAAATLCNKW